MTDISIRAAKPSDVSDIQNIARESWSDVYEGIIPAFAQQRALQTWYSTESLKAAMASPDTALLVAEASGRTIAFAQIVFLPNAAASLTRIYVLPSRQRSGTGRKLFAALLEEAKARGVSRIGVSVAAANQRAGKFYEKVSFRRSGEQQLDLFGFVLTEATYELVIHRERPN